MAAAIVVGWDPSSFQGQMLLVYASPMVSAGRTRNARRNHKLIQQFNALFARTHSSGNITAAYTAKYGALVAGTRIFVYLRTIDSSGAAGPMVSSSCVVT